MNCFLFVQIPKNYAFSYSVKNKHSGDDFSHSQAHNGKATKGQYRVKLPDGRVQVVSYTADHGGYRADVQYEGSPHNHQAGFEHHNYVQHSTPRPHHHHHHQSPAPEQYVHVTPTPDHYSANHQQYIHPSSAPEQYIHASPTPGQYIHPSPTPEQYVHVSPTPEQYNHPSPTPEQYIHASPAPEQQRYHQPQHQFVHFVQHQQEQRPYYPEQEVVYTATPAPFRKQPSFNPTAAPYQQFSPTPSSYDYPIEFTGPTAGYRSFNSQPRPDSAQSQANIASPSPITFPTSAPEPAPQYATSPGLEAYASPAPGQFDHSNFVRSTPAPFSRYPNDRSGQVLVTPRSQRSSNDKNKSPKRYGDRNNVINRSS